MKKKFILSLLPSILLMSCGEFKPFGLYEFRLGKTDGNHLEVSAELTDVKHEKHEDFYKLVLRADLGDAMSPAAIIESYQDKYPFLQEFLGIITSEMKDMDHIEGFYKLSNLKNEKYGYRVDVGSDMLVEYVQKLANKYAELKDIIDSIDSEKLVFMPETTRYIFSAYVNKKAFTIQIPVSMDDLTMQSIWYGKTAKISEENFIDKMPGVKGIERFGTHPKYVVKNGVVVEDEISLVNEMFKKDFSNTAIYEDPLCIAEIAKLVEEEVNGVKKIKVFFLDSYTGDKSLVTGNVQLKSIFGDYDETTEIKITVDSDGYISCLGNGKIGKEAGFIDENGFEVKFNYLMQPPFVFRDYHVVNVGLSKVVD